MGWRSRESVEGYIIGGNQEILSMEKFGGYKTEVKGRIESRETLALRNKVKEEVHLLIEIQRGVKTRCRNENVFARPNGLLDNAETGPARKYIYIHDASSRKEEEKYV